MSVRVELSAFNTATLLASLGSGNLEIVDEMLAAMSEAVAAKKPWALGLGEKGRVQYAETLSRAVLEGTPVDGLRTENRSHVLLASHLAHRGQRHRRIDCGIPCEILQDLLEEQGPLLPSGGKKLLRYLSSGRPLFGRRFAPGAAYGYLFHEQTLALRESLKQYAQSLNAEEDGVELAEELIECLEQGLAYPKHPDLWIAIG